MGAAGMWMLPVMFIFSLGTAWEFSRLAKNRVAIKPWQATCLTALILTLASIPILYVAFTGKPYPSNCPIGRLGWIAIGCVVCNGIAGCMTLRSFSLGEPATIERWAILTLIPVYVGGLSSFWVAIRTSGDPNRALWNLVGIIAIAKISDAAAYFTGRAIGRRKLCPSISPGKTVEGALGGLFFSAMAGILYFCFLVPAYEIASDGNVATAWWQAGVLGVCLALVAMLGDLIESMVKRSAGAKDSSRLLPGLGGLWDVTDSLLPTAAIGYLGVLAKWI